LERGQYQPWSGAWRLTIPGVATTSQHKTKREAVAAGCRQLAILDWHAAQAAAAALDVLAPGCTPECQMCTPGCRSALYRGCCGACCAED
jgi:hypothetical protein